MSKIHFLLSLVITVSSTAVLADMVKPAILSINCIEVQATIPRSFKIVSNSKGSQVIFLDKSYADRQIYMGTEGGAPYAQAVSSKGGYNITLSGGDMEKAFNESSTYTRGKANAHVQLFNGTNISSSFNAVCTGLMSFKN